jgi:serine/threonine protein kinase
MEGGDGDMQVEPDLGMGDPEPFLPEPAGGEMGPGGGGGGQGAEAGPPPPPMVVQPERLPAPRLTPAVRRMYEVEDDRGRASPLTCVASLQTRAVYGLIRTVRPAIYGKVKVGVQLELRQDTGAYRVCTDRPVAVKIIQKAKLGGALTEDPLKEISIMQHLAEGEGGMHPNVMGLIEVVEDEEYIYMILPYCDGGELCQWFERSRFNLHEDLARRFFVQMLEGTAFLHRRGVVHRDMSLENLLYDERTNRCCIIDMGMALKLPCPAQHQVVVPRQGRCGKLTYMSPEIYENRDFRASAVDVWALGVILFIMVSGVPPVERPSPIDPRYAMIAQGRLFQLMDMWQINFLSAEARDLLFQLLQVDPARRLTIDQIFQHPWVVQYFQEEPGPGGAGAGADGGGAMGGGAMGGGAMGV